MMTNLAPSSLVHSVSSGGIENEVLSHDTLLLRVSGKFDIELDYGTCWFC